VGPGHAAHTDRSAGRGGRVVSAAAARALLDGVSGPGHQNRRVAEPKGLLAPRMRMERGGWGPYGGGVNGG